jgi:ParB-like chromosome segregation protein Spo0J
MTDRFLEKTKRRAVPVNKIEKKAPFLDMFTINTDMVTTITEHMNQNGYDKNYPIIVWDRGNSKGNHQRYILVDGHTRLQAAQNVGMDSIYASCVTFPDEDTAFEYAVHNQRDRRNMTDADLVRHIAAVDQLKRKGQRTDLAQGCAKSGKSAAETAKVVGKSTRQVEKVRYIEKHADDETKAAVKSGEKSINKAYQETRAKRKKKTPPTTTPESQKPKNQDGEPSTEDAVSDDSISWETLPAHLESINKFLYDNARVPDSIVNRKEIILQIQWQAGPLLTQAGMLM